MPVPRKPAHPLRLAGAAALAGAAIAGEIGWLHMRWVRATYGVLCGDAPFAHCAACPTALALLAAGLALLSLAALGANTTGAQA